MPCLGCHEAPPEPDPGGGSTLWDLVSWLFSNSDPDAAAPDPTQDGRALPNRARSPER
jgi:hypothetical protein